jgi:hypothetical protein
MLCVKLFMGKSCSTPEVKTVTARSRRTYSKFDAPRISEILLAVLPIRARFSRVNVYHTGGPRYSRESRIGLLPDSTRILSSSVLSAVWPTSLESQSLIK